MSDVLRPAEATVPVDVDERDYIPADFSDLLVAGESIISVARTLEVVSGIDAAPGSRLVGATEISGASVRQWVEGVAEGAEYLLRLVATTSDNGRRVVIAVRFKGVRVS